MEFEVCCHGMQKPAVGFLGRRWLLFCFCVLLCASGCAKKISTLEPADLPVSLVLAEMEDRRSQIFSFRAAGTLRVETGEQSWSGRAFILCRMPQSLRLEVLSFFGQPALYLVSDGNRFLFWEPGSARAYEGFASDNTLASLIKFPLRDSETLLLLAGILPSWDYQAAKLFKVRGNGTIMLQLEDAPRHLTQRVWLEADEFSVTRIELLRGSRVELEADFADFVAVDGSLYPRDILINGDKVTLKVRYKQFVINEPLQEETFQLRLPEGIEIHPW